MLKSFFLSLFGRRPTLVVLRGLPGSGKSTRAQEYVARGFIHHENDHYMLDENGVYSWTPERMYAAIDSCMQAIEESLAAGHDVVVSNVLSKAAHVQNYVDLARRLGAAVEVHTVIGNYGNVHNVPEEVVNNLRATWEEYELE